MDVMINGIILDIEFLKVTFFMTSGLNVDLSEIFITKLV